MDMSRKVWYCCVADRGEQQWYTTTLQEYKYLFQHALLQKKYSTETFPPVKKCNRGEMPQYYVENSHPPIIDRDVFTEAQKLLKSKRPNLIGKPKHQHFLKQKIICGNCGTPFRRLVGKGIPYWVCNNHNHGGDCGIQPIREIDLHSAFLRLYFNLANHKEIFSGAIKNLMQMRKRMMLWHPDVIELNTRISDIMSQSHTLSLLNKQGMVDPDIFISKSNQLAEQLRKAKQQKEKLLSKEEDNFIEETRDIMEVLAEGPDYLEEFDEELFCELIDKIIVESNTKIRFRLKNGLELPESIERTVR